MELKTKLMVFGGGLLALGGLAWFAFGGRKPGQLYGLEGTHIKSTKRGVRCFRGNKFAPMSECGR